MGSALTPGERSAARIGLVCYGVLVLVVVALWLLGVVPGALVYGLVAGGLFAAAVSFSYWGRPS